MKYGSLFSGIGGFDLGLDRAGWQPAWQVEFDEKASDVLRYHWPEVPKFRDVREVQPDELEPVDLVCFGSPCQDLSVAGRRAGLDGERSGLFVEAIRIADSLAPRWLLFENVPGLLSSQRGEDFAVVLEGFTGFRPSVPEGGWQNGGCAVGPLRWAAWCILDSQFFGVAQRRRRVFVVAGAGTEPAPEILLECPCLCGHPPPRREERHGGDRRPALSIALRGREGGGSAEVGDDVAHALRASQGGGDRPHVLVFNWQSGGDCRGLSPSEHVTNALHVGQVPAVAFAQNQRGELRTADVSLQLTAGGGKPGQGYPAVLTEYGLRRLLPVECERLQGFPEVKRKVIIEVWDSSEKASRGAPVEAPCRSERSSAASADGSGSYPPASSAEASSVISQPGHVLPVVASVLINCERSEIRVSPQSRECFAPVGGADENRWPLLPTARESIAQLSALIALAKGPVRIPGRAESPTRSAHSLHQRNGSSLVSLSGQEIDELASDAERFTAEVNRCTRFITSGAGESSLSFAEILRTSCCCVAAAISGSIPRPTLDAGSYAISLELSAGWTLHARRADGTVYQQADSPRYRQLGNAVTVAVSEWIGRRILAAAKAAEAAA